MRLARFRWKISRRTLQTLALPLGYAAILMRRSKFPPDLEKQCDALLPRLSPFVPKVASLRRKTVSSMSRAYRCVVTIEEWPSNC